MSKNTCCRKYFVSTNFQQTNLEAFHWTFLSLLMRWHPLLGCQLAVEHRWHVAYGTGGISRRHGDCLASLGRRAAQHGRLMFRLIVRLTQWGLVVGLMHFSLYFCCKLVCGQVNLYTGHDERKEPGRVSCPCASCLSQDSSTKGITEQGEMSKELRIKTSIIIRHKVQACTTK